MPIFEKEMTDSDMTALLYTQKALSKIMSVTGEVRPVSVKFRSVHTEDARRIYRTVQLLVKLRNPFGDDPNIAEVNCMLWRSKDVSDVSPWHLDRLDVSTRNQGGFTCFKAEDLSN